MCVSAGKQSGSSKIDTHNFLSGPDPNEILNGACGYTHIEPPYVRCRLLFFYIGNQHLRLSVSYVSKQGFRKLASNYLF